MPTPGPLKPEDKEALRRLHQQFQQDRESGTVPPLLDEPDAQPSGDVLDGQGPPEAPGGTGDIARQSEESGATLQAMLSELREHGARLQRIAHFTEELHGQVMEIVDAVRGD
jgi:hypothetical protein